MAEQVDKYTGEIMKVEEVPLSALEQITRGEIDIQISTAKRFPRSIATFLGRAREIVSIDIETAESCLYRRPVGKGKNEEGKWVDKYAEGMSIRMAEIVGATYGNLRVGSMLIEQTERYVKARGFAHDLETNYACSCEVIEATIDKDGKPLTERMRIVIAKAALSKARRDATFMVVPKAMCKPLETTARNVAIGDETTLLSRRAKVLAWVDSLGKGKSFDRARVYTALGISGEADLGLDELAQLTGIKTAIGDGDVTIDEAFPKIIEARVPVFQKKDDATTAPKSATPPASDQPPSTQSQDAEGRLIDTPPPATQPKSTE